MTKPWEEKKFRDQDLPNSTKFLSRKKLEPRPDWENKCQAEGLPYAHYPGVLWPSGGFIPESWARDPYWNESSAYEVNSAGMWQIEKASYELHSMCLEAAAEVVESDDLLEKFGIPAALWPAIRHSWRTRETDLAGRLDLLWNGVTPPKLAEYNADTPTVLVESAGAQRSWFLDFLSASQTGNAGKISQFNVLQEALEAAFRELRDDYERTAGSEFSAENPLTLIFTTQKPSADSEFLEERSTMGYMYKRASSTGIPSEMVDIEEFDEPVMFESILKASSVNNPVLAASLVIWKLYPYEWLIQEKLGLALTNPAFLNGHTRWLEPAWKLVLSSKAMLAYLWEKHPGHENLLPAFYSFDHAEMAASSEKVSLKHIKGNEWVAKPRFGREGAGIMYSDGYKTWNEFRNAVLDSSAASGDRQIIPGFTATPIGDETTFTTSFKTNLHGIMDLSIGQFSTKLQKLIKESSIKPDAHIKTLMDREWGGKHVHDGAPFGYHVGQPILQAYFEPAELSGRTIVTSSWVVRGVPVAACFREDIAKTTNDDSSFVPHYISTDPSSNGNGTQSYPLTRRQRRLRAELYGTLPVTRRSSRTTTHGQQLMDNDDQWIESYMNGGFSGCGTAPVGGGGARANRGFWKDRVRSHSDLGSSYVGRARGWYGNYGSRTAASHGQSTGHRGHKASESAKDRPQKPNTHRDRFRTGTTSRGAARAGRSGRS